MKARPYTLLLHPLFFISLFILLLNDFYLKYEFHNWLTGKLSDFTGSFVFTVFLFAFFPAHKKKIAVFYILFFCWWKSPLSSPAIYFANHFLLLPFHRVIDYTDLAALLMLPLAYRLIPPVYPASLLRSLAIYTISAFSFFSFCATSVIRNIQDEEINLNKSFRTRLTEEDIVTKFKEKGIAIEKDTAYYKQLDGHNKYLKIKDTSGEEKTIRIADYKEMELYVRSVPYLPTYTIPVLVINKDTLRKVRFSIDQMYNGKKRIITLKSLAYDSTIGGLYFPSPFRGQRKLTKPVRQRIEEILQ